MEKKLFDAVTKFTIEQIHEELYQIKRDLDWLDDNIALTRQQRSTYNDISTRVKKLLGYK